MAVGMAALTMLAAGLVFVPLWGLAGAAVAACAGALVQAAAQALFIKRRLGFFPFLFRVACPPQAVKRGSAHIFGQNAPHARSRGTVRIVFAVITGHTGQRVRTAQHQVPGGRKNLFTGKRWSKKRKTRPATAP